MNNQFPDKIKEAVIISVIKTGETNQVVNYRPISVWNSMANIFEHIIYDHILTTLISLHSNSMDSYQVDRQ